MQRGYTKLFNTIVTSTIWQEDKDTRIVWITMLAIADRFGTVSAALPGLASVANVELAAAEKAIKNLEAPDEYSRTKEHNGRRIEPVDGGWKILNYIKYRMMLDEEDRKDYQARWIAEKRRQKSISVDRSRKQSTKSTQADSESKAEAVPKRLDIVLVYAKEIGLSKLEAEKFFDFFTSNGWKVSGRAPMKDWKASLRNWKRNQKNNGARADQRNSVDPSKIDLPERFKSWAAEHYPSKREDVMKWQTWADVPNSLRQEWWREEKEKLPIEI